MHIRASHRPFPINVTESAGELTASATEIQYRTNVTADLRQKSLGIPLESHVFHEMREATPCIRLEVLALAALIQEANIRKRRHCLSMPAAAALNDFNHADLATPIEKLA